MSTYPPRTEMFNYQLFFIFEVFEITFFFSDNIHAVQGGTGIPSDQDIGRFCRVTGRDLRDTDFAGYPANNFAGSRISCRICGLIPDIRPYIWVKINFI